MASNARIIVVGNEKGGTGKSTVAMHLLMLLTRQGVRAAGLDLDARQATLSRYVENRRRRGERDPHPLAVPALAAVPPDSGTDAFGAALEDVARAADVVVIDTPGADTPLSRAAHIAADLLVTPLNDSFIDLDVLAQVDPVKMRIDRLSHYSEMVWEARKRRALAGLRATDWFVMRNRLSSLDARNKREMERLLGELSRRVGFRLVEGLGERVIYRELFLDGLTLLDLGDEGTAGTLTLSHVAARQELRRLAFSLGLAADTPPSEGVSDSA